MPVLGVWGCGGGEICWLQGCEGMFAGVLGCGGVKGRLRRGVERVCVCVCVCVRVKMGVCV